MKSIIFPDFPYKIGDEFEIKDEYQTSYYRKGIIYVIDDITYSIANEEWEVTLFYYEGYMDKGFSYVGLNNLVNEFNRTQDED